MRNPYIYILIIYNAIDSIVINSYVSDMTPPRCTHKLNVTSMILIRYRIDYGILVSINNVFNVK